MQEWIINLFLFFVFNVALKLSNKILYFHFLTDHSYSYPHSRLKKTLHSIFNFKKYNNTKYIDV